MGCGVAWNATCLRIWEVRHGASKKALADEHFGQAIFLSDRTSERD